MIRKNTVSLIFTIAMALALLTGLLLTPVTSHGLSDSAPTPTAIPASIDYGIPAHTKLAQCLSSSPASMNCLCDCATALAGDRPVR